MKHDRLIDTVFTIFLARLKNLQPLQNIAYKRTVNTVKPPVASNSFIFVRSYWLLTYELEKTARNTPKQ